MTEADILQLFNNSWLGITVREVRWLFGAGETLHFIGLSMLIGAMIVVDLRLLGVWKRIPISAVLPFTKIAIAGFAINVISGLAFFCSNPFNYWSNPAFKLKMFLIVLAGLNVLWFELAERKKVVGLAVGGDTAMDTKINAGLSLTLWILIIIFGRLLPTFEGATSLFS